MATSGGGTKDGGGKKGGPAGLPGKKTGKKSGGGRDNLPPKPKPTKS